MNFLCVMLIPDGDRMHLYYDNWMGGLAMQMIGPLAIRLLLNAFVVVVGFLILSGAVNTSIVGSNGVLSRVAEDGVLPDWFLKPHPRLGTNYRLLYLITGLQLFTIIASRGDVIVLGEAYAFGVVWSFVFNTMSMVVLRFKKRGPREFLVPCNIRVGNLYLPIGLSLVFLTVFAAALANLVTKPTATIGGLAFAGVFLTDVHRHRETPQAASPRRAPRTSRAVQSRDRPPCDRRKPRPYQTVSQAGRHSLAEQFVHARQSARGERPANDRRRRDDGQGRAAGRGCGIAARARHLRPATADGRGQPRRAARQNRDAAAGAHQQRAARGAQRRQGSAGQEVILGASNKYTAEEQLDQIALYWINLHHGEPQGVTVHIVSADRAVTFDLHGGNRIPRVADRQAKSVADLRAAGIGIRRVLLVHDGTLSSHDVFEWMITMVAPDVHLDLVPVTAEGTAPSGDRDPVHLDQQRAAQLGRPVRLLAETAAKRSRDRAAGARRELRRARAALARRRLDSAQRRQLTIGSIRAAKRAMQRVPGSPPGDSARSRWELTADSLE